MRVTLCQSWFHATPCCWDFLGLRSRKLFFTLLANCIARMRALTPVHRSLQRAGIPAYCVLSSCHSIPKHPMQSGHRFNSQVSVIRVFRLRHGSEGSPLHKTETGSSSYGLTVRFQLLSTPPRGDAVTFNYRDFWLSLIRTFTVLIARPCGRTGSSCCCLFNSSNNLIYPCSSKAIAMSLGTNKILGSN